VPSLPDRWQVERFGLGAGEFHALDVVEPVARTVWVSRPPTPALVLGSMQSSEIVDPAVAARLGVDVVRRRSGGGAVLVVPGELCWIDLLIDRDDPLWDDDVGRAMHWVGELWQSALAGLGVTAEVHRGPLVRTAWSDLVCFAGLGPGEVVGEGGEKLVGVSQRRTRTWARFQTACLVRWDPSSILDLLTAHLSDGGLPLARAAGGTGRTVADLEAAVLASLPAA